MVLEIGYTKNYLMYSGLREAIIVSIFHSK
jgi:hypothetical protein